MQKHQLPKKEANKHRSRSKYMAPKGAIFFIQVGWFAQRFENELLAYFF